MRKYYWLDKTSCSNILYNIVNHLSKNFKNKKSLNAKEVYNEYYSNKLILNQREKLISRIIAEKKYYLPLYLIDAGISSLDLILIGAIIVTLDPILQFFPICVIDFE